MFTARKRSLGQGNIFTGVCQSICSWRGGGLWCHFPFGCLVPCSFQGCLCPGCLCLGDLCPGVTIGGSLSERPPRGPHMVKSGKEASYWYAFLFYFVFCSTCNHRLFKDITVQRGSEDPRYRLLFTSKQRFLFCSKSQKLPMRSMMIGVLAEAR